MGARSLDASRRLGMAAHADLKTRRDESILVLPERAIRLGGSGGEILRLVCAGRSAEVVLATMCERYPDAHDLAGEVLGFLEQMLAVGGIVYTDEDVDTSA